ncbi:MAG: FAD-dependent oxidoreductase, partial [Pseudomonadota bacterium]
RITQAGGDDAAAPLRVGLSDGGDLEAKLVVMAVGVRSNTGYLVGSGIDVKSGVRVGSHLQTSVPDVYAAGDVAEARDLSTGDYDVLAIQPTAVEHGRLAALNMAGHETRHHGCLNMNVLDTMGLISSSFGLWDGARGANAASGSMVDEARYRYLRLEFDGERMVGAQSVGMTDHVGMLRGLIQTGAPLGGWRDKLIKAPERVREAYIACAQGMSHHGPMAPKVALPA